MSTTERDLKWHRRFLARARLVAESSKDPSTKTGAVIVDSDMRSIADGYNGFPRGVGDYCDRYNDRALKYKMVVHAEVNAVIFARRDLHGCTIYVWPWMPCATCAGVVIQSGIRRVVTVPADVERQERWKEDFTLTALMFQEAKVELILLEREIPCAICPNGIHNETLHATSSRALLRSAERETK